LALFFHFCAFGNKFDLWHLATNFIFGIWQQIFITHTNKNLDVSIIMPLCCIITGTDSERPIPLPPSYQQVMEERRTAKITDGQVGMLTQQSYKTFISHTSPEHALISLQMTSFHNAEPLSRT
jgi:hypothetical protein